MSVKEEANLDSDETTAQEKLSIDIPQTEFYVKCEEKTAASGIVKVEATSPVVKTENATTKEEVSLKREESDTKSDYSFDALRSESKVFVKNDIQPVKSETKCDLKVDSSRTKKEPLVKKEEMQVVAKGTVEIIDQNEPDTEVEEFSSPTWCRTMESDAILKQRVAEMQLEFSGGIAEVVNIASENEKSDDEKKPEEEAACKCQEAERSDDSASIDEFDVEAQMKKITGDDGNDYQEKIDTSSERDKSIDGIEGLMESSKEDSDSEDKDIELRDVKYCASVFKLFSQGEETRVFKESDQSTKSEQIAVTEDNNAKETSDKGTNQELAKTEQSSVLAASLEESIFESTSTSMDAEPVADPPKTFQPIPPLSERIRRKTDPIVTPKTTPSLDFEAAIIESTISTDAVDESKNGEQKSMLSSALRELLEAKLDDEPAKVTKNENINNEAADASQVAQPAKPSDSPECSTDVRNSSTPTPTLSPRESRPEEAPPVKEEEAKPKEIKRLKDPRTVVPNNMPAPSAFKSDAVVPVKRKVRTVGECSSSNFCC